MESIGPLMATLLREAAYKCASAFGSTRVAYPVQCRLGVNVVIPTVRRSLPAYPGKQTFSEPVATSHLRHTSSARAGSAHSSPGVNFCNPIKTDETGFIHLITDYLNLRELDFLLR
jgi:hypothetical protein